MVAGKYMESNMFRNRRCKGPEAGCSLVYWKDREKTNVAQLHKALKALQAMVRNLDFLLMSDDEPLEDFQQGVICIVLKDQSGCSVENRLGRGLQAA